MTAQDVISRAEAAGIRMIARDTVLELHAETAPPDDIVEEIRRYKRSILARIARERRKHGADDMRARFARRAHWFEQGRGLPSDAARAESLAACLLDWQMREPIDGGEVCAHCGVGPRPWRAVSVYRPDPSHSAWLHAECVERWRAHRASLARSALRRLGVHADARPHRCKSSSDFGKIGAA